VIGVVLLAGNSCLSTARDSLLEVVSKENYKLRLIAFGSLTICAADMHNVHIKISWLLGIPVFSSKLVC
jgi:hypothetical protein